jgi:hypothetical protein
MDLTTMPTVASYNVPHELAPQTAYLLLGLLLVPHYCNKGMYVAPGNQVYPNTYLELFGAEKITLPLWPRKYP